MSRAVIVACGMPGKCVQDCRSCGCRSGQRRHSNEHLVNRERLGRRKRGPARLVLRIRVGWCGSALGGANGGPCGYDLDGSNAAIVKLSQSRGGLRIHQSSARYKTVTARGRGRVRTCTSPRLAGIVSALPAPAPWALLAADLRAEPRAALGQGTGKDDPVRRASS